MENNKPYPTNQVDMQGFFLHLYKWRWPILSVVSIAVIGAVIFSGPAFISPKYKATVIVYASKTYSVSKSILGDTYHPDILEFGEEEQAEKLIQIINSDQIRNTVIDSYDLANHYKINPKSKNFRTNLYNTYEENINVERTPFMSVKISVLDEDPETAMNMANDISNLIDSSWNKVTSERSSHALNIIDFEYNNKYNYLRFLEDSLTKLRLLGVYQYDVQARILDRRYIRALENYTEAKGRLSVLEKNSNDHAKIINERAKKAGAEAVLAELKTKQEVFAQYGGPYWELTEMTRKIREEMMDLRSRSEKTKIDLEQNLPHKFIVNQAILPDKKAYPVRWLIVLVAGVSSFFLCLISITIIENFKKLKHGIRQREAITKKEELAIYNL